MFQRCVPLTLCLAVCAACATAPVPEVPPAVAVPEATPAPPQRPAVAPAPVLVAPSVQLANLQQQQPTAVVVAALQQAVDGLLYTSESDYPFQVLVVPGGASPHVTAYNIKQKLASVYVPRPETMPLAQRKVQSTSLVKLLKNYVQPQDWWSDFERERAPKFQALKHLISQQLRHVHVYRVGPKTPWGLGPDIDVFIVGTTATGDLVVLWTVSIET